MPFSALLARLYTFAKYELICASLNLLLGCIYPSQQQRLLRDIWETPSYVLMLMWQFVCAEIGKAKAESFWKIAK